MDIHKNKLMRVAVTNFMVFGALTLSACATQSLLPNPAATSDAQDKTDPNVRCKPTYTQVYQPPLKLGGAGRVIMVPSGEKCEKNRKKFETSKGKPLKNDNGIENLVHTHVYEKTDYEFISRLMGIERSGEEPLLVWLPEVYLSQMRIAYGIEDRLEPDTTQLNASIQWLEHQSSIGSNIATYHLAYLHLYGISYSQSSEVAEKMFVDLANKGDPDGHFALSEIYKSHKYGLFNQEKAKYHFQQAGMIIQLQWAENESNARKYNR